MAGSVADTLYDLLVADAVLTAQLAKYAGQPAIFTIRPIPADAAMPYVIIEGPSADVAVRTLGEAEVRREITRDVSIFGPATGSSRAVQDIAERVRTVLHGASVMVDGFARGRATATGPIQLSADEDTYGRLVSAHLRLAR